MLMAADLQTDVQRAGATHRGMQHPHDVQHKQFSKHAAWFALYATV